MLKKIFSCAAFVCLLCACSGIPKEREVTVSNVDITGFIGSYVKVVDGTYKFTTDGDKASISVKFELTDKPNVEFHKDGWDIRLNAIDETGSVFDTGTYSFSCKEFSKISELLKGNVGDTKTVSFTWEYIDFAKELGKAIFTKATSFEIIDEIFKEGSETISVYSDNSANDSKSSTSEVTSDSEDWDKALDEYEKYIDSYIKILKKVKANDMSAISEYPTYVEKAESFSKKFDNAKGTMSAKQIKRYTELTMKITTAAME